jgi:hypothetical protein
MTIVVLTEVSGDRYEACIKGHSVAVTGQKKNAVGLLPLLFPREFSFEMTAMFKRAYQNARHIGTSMLAHPEEYGIRITEVRRTKKKRR